MRIFTEEVFGPVAVLEIAPRPRRRHRPGQPHRRSASGPASGPTDPEERRRCIEEIESGKVFVNAMVASTPELPFGGIKRSGYGRELSALGIKEFCNAKTVWVA